MPVLSDAYPVAFTGEISAEFRYRRSVKIQVRFYSDLEGLTPLAKGIGSRDITVSTTDHFVVRSDGSESDLPSDYAGGTKNGVGGVWTEFEFADGSNNVRCVLTAGTNPGALSYRVGFSIERDPPK